MTIQIEQLILLSVAIGGWATVNVDRGAVEMIYRGREIGAAREGDEGVDALTK